MAEHSLKAAVLLAMQEFQRLGMPKVPVTFLAKATHRGLLRLQEEGIPSPFHQQDGFEEEFDFAISELLQVDADTRFAGREGSPYDSAVSLDLAANLQAVRVLEKIEARVVSVFCAPIREELPRLLKIKGDFEKKLREAEKGVVEAQKQLYPHLPWAGD